MSRLAPVELQFPFAEPPSVGEPREVVPGILWLRLALPFALDHVNVYLIEDQGGWALLDTGVSDTRTRATWEALLEGPLKQRPITRILVSHFHPDHVGLAGWLTDRCSVDLWMPRTEYLVTQFHRRPLPDDEIAAHRVYYRSSGLDPAAIEAVIERDVGYRAMTTDLPITYHRLAAGDVLRIGRRRFEVLTGGGHAPELAMLACPEERLFLVTDQVLARISPNVSVWPQEPDADPLADYLRSLAALRTQVPEEALVLPAHHLPFVGFRRRVDELIRHHAIRCDEVARACGYAPRSPGDLLPILFRRKLDALQTSFAFGEALAHLNYMLRRDELVAERGADGVLRVRLPG